MSRKPFLPIVLFYITGILINIPYSYFLLLGSMLIFFILFFLRYKASIIPLYLSIILFGSFSCLLHSYKGAFHIANYIGEKGNLIGTIIDYPNVYPESTYLVVRVESFNGKKASGLLSVSTRDNNLSLGDRLFIPSARIKEPREYKNPGRYNRKKILARQKIYACVFADHLIKLGQGKINLLLLFASKIKIKANEILSLLSKEEKEFLAGIILGERRGISDKMEKAFTDTGTIHILSVSGFHLALLFGFLVFVLQSLGIKKPHKFILPLPILFLFCLVTGSSPPTLRSLIMALVFILSFVFEREANFYNTLSCAAFVLLLLNPYELYNIGFQLSFVACFSLAYLTPRLKIKKGTFFLFISSCLAASLGTAPLVLFWFSRVSLVSPITNLFVIPLVGVLLPAGFVFILIGFINLHLASLLSLFVSLLTNFTMKTILLFSYIPASSIDLPLISLPLVIFLYLLIIVFAERIKRLFIPIFFILNIFLWYEVLKPKAFEVTFLDVGQGDSIFIRSPKGCNILIDGGPPGLGRSCLLPFLRYKGIDRIDLLITTHSDADHIGGMAEVIKELNVKRIFYNGLGASSKTYKEFEETIKKRGLFLQRLKMGDKILGLDLEIEVLNPLPGQFLGDNNNSIVLRIRKDKLSFLLPGDIEEEAEAFLCTSYKENLKSTILKAPHHGRKPIPESFLSLVKPKLIIVQGSKKVFPCSMSTEINGAITIKGFKKGFDIFCFGY